ncbi:MAG TPA: hypothetical protein VFL76_08750 [Edaphocola sp.]|nr:hypothetical protein [Edaphocola sp.]
MKQKLLIIGFLIPFIFISCFEKKGTANENKKEIFFIEGRGGADIIRKTEKVISKKGNIETVEGFDPDKPSQVLYLYQRMRISGDSTVLNGIFKTFYPNNQLRGVFHFKNGKQEGLTLMYRPNGILEKKGYRYWGMYMGPQYEYDTSGQLKSIYFMSNDSSYWLIVQYNNSGKIESMKGQNYLLMFPIKEHYGVDETMKVDIQLPRLQNTNLSVRYILRSSKSLFDTTISDFAEGHTALFSGMNYKFKEKSRGENNLKIIVKLMDNTNNKLLKEDSFSKVILVN